MTHIAVIGAGSWGTALAIQLARNHHYVQLWGRNKEALEECHGLRVNHRYLPGVPFPEGLVINRDLPLVLKDCAWVVVAVPSEGFRETMEMLKKKLAPNTPLCWVTKGLDKNTGHLLSDVAQEILGDTWPLCLLSGPSFAKEVAVGLPTTVLIAGNQWNTVQALQGQFHSHYFRVYTTEDMISVQVAGAVKNVLAIATGVCDGLKLGANARAGLITRGLAEMARLGVAMGGKQSTFMGLAGMGDLLLTCTDNQSRNRRFGLALGEGFTVEKAIKGIGQVVEGCHNALLVRQLGEQKAVDMPIVRAVDDLLKGQLGVKKAMEVLLSREPGVE